METFHTGERAPSTRMYTFVGHMESSTCSLRQDERHTLVRWRNISTLCKLWHWCFLGYVTGLITNYWRS